MCEHSFFYFTHVIFLYDRPLSSATSISSIYIQYNTNEYNCTNIYDHWCNCNKSSLLRFGKMARSFVTTIVLVLRCHRFLQRQSGQIQCEPFILTAFNPYRHKTQEFFVASAHCSPQLQECLLFLGCGQNGCGRNL